MDGLWFSASETERTALWRLQLHSHGWDLRVDLVNSVLVGAHVCGDQTKVICIWKSHYLVLSQLVTFVRISFKFLQNRVEHKQKDHGAERIALKDTTFETEWIRSPGLALHHCSAVWIEIVQVLPDHWRHKVSFKRVINQRVRNWPKGVLQVEERYVTCPTFVLCIFYHFIHTKVMFNDSINARQECFLQLRIDKPVGCRERCETVCDQKVISFSNAPCECNHPNIWWVACITFFVKELHHRLSPWGRVSAWGEDFVEQSGENVVCAIKFQECVVSDSLQPYSSIHGHLRNENFSQSVKWKNSLNGSQNKDI